MKGVRYHRLSSLIQDEMSHILVEVIPTHKAIVSVVKVLLSKDYSFAKIYVSIYPAQKRESVMQELESKLPTIRRMLASRIGHTTKKIPLISFVLDDSLDFLMNIDNILSEEGKSNEG